ncbi:2454_t:CDS:1, partial [Acaulospora morrowiae]
KQISNLPRKKGQYVSQKEHQIVIETIINTIINKEYQVVIKKAVIAKKAVITEGAIVANNKNKIIMGLTTVTNNEHRITMEIVAATKIVAGISDKNQTITETTINITNPYDEEDLYIMEAATNIQKVSEKWINEDLREFEDIRKRFLIWNDNAESNLRTTYTGNSRTTL